jgi:hypothetical protein
MATLSKTKPHPANTHVTAIEKDAALDALYQQGVLWMSEQGSTDCHHKYTVTTAHAPNTKVIPFGTSAIDSHLPHGGLATCAVHEIAYNDPLLPQAVASTIPAVLAHSAHSRLQHHFTCSGWRSTAQTSCDTPYIVWIGKRCWPSPFLLSALDTPDTPYEERLLQRSLFIDPPSTSATLWAIETSLRSRAVHLVVATCPKISRTTTQRFAHAARNHNTTAILLRAYSDMMAPSCARSRWCVAPVSSSHDTAAWELRLIKLTGAPYQQMSWIVSLQSNDQLTSLHTSSAHPNSFLRAYKTTPPQIQASPGTTPTSFAVRTA